MLIINWNRPNVTKIHDTIIKPGINHISGSKAKSMIKDPVFKYQVERGILIIIKAPKDVKTPQKQSGGLLSDLDEKSALNVIKDTFDVEFLRKFEQDTRAKVKAAVKKQLKEIEGEGKSEPDES